MGIEPSKLGCCSNRESELIYKETEDDLVAIAPT